MPAAPVVRRLGWARFGLGTLLFATLCLGGFLGGYRAGYQQGAEQYVAQQMTTVEYGLADLLTVRPDPEELEAVAVSVKEAIGTNDGGWQGEGGRGKLETNLENVSLIVLQSQAAHKRIIGALEMIRVSRGIPPLTHQNSLSLSTKSQTYDVRDLVADTRGSPGFAKPSLEAALGEFLGEDSNGNQAVPFRSPPTFEPGVFYGNSITVRGNAAVQLRAKEFLDSLRKLEYVSGEDGER